MLRKVKKFVDESFGRKSPHFERTVYWVKKLKPDADEALLVAAYAHDIERAFQKKTVKFKSFLDKEKLKQHQEKGAEITASFLEKEGADDDLIERVKMLISKHEFGGNKDQDLLKDADSISFLENNTDYFVNELAKKTGKSKVKEKFDWMFERISSDKAKRIAKPMYLKAVRLLELS
ncbi:DUF4202 domain-containing protein [Patescibacteria group bacterium]|nr:DUF4202 domain-containing protein [Patescibacteria group bacterium]